VTIDALSRLAGEGWRGGLVALLALCACDAPTSPDVGPRRDAPGLDAAIEFPDVLALDAPGLDAPDLDAPAPGTDAAARAFAFDLDGDGRNDTDLTLVPASGGGALRVETETESFEIALPGARVPATGVSLTGRTIQVVGQHEGAPRSEVAVLHALERGTHASVAMSVLDVDARAVLATASSPTALARFESYDLGAFGGVLAGAANDTPFLAPGYGDGPAASWGYACLFRAGASGARCGAGFVEIDTTAPGTWFREVGGLTSDLDGDGTGDLTLVYHQRLRSYSGTTGALLADTEYDVALTDEPASPRWFHSGRNYGTLSFVRGADGRDRTLVVGGAPVGSFTDYNCNVSRFVAVLEQARSAPSSRALAWSDYFGFASTIFRTYSPAFASDPAADVSRLGDFTSGCIHRFGDSRVVVSGEDAVMFDYFVASGPVDTCLDEQYALYLPPTWTPDKVAAWNACISRIVGQTGTWGMQVRRLRDGTSLTGSQGTYVWGATDRLLPSRELVFVVESVPTTTRFDLTDVAPSALHVWALVGGLWVPRGGFPTPGRPAITGAPAGGDVGVGSFTGLATLDLSEGDGDGLAELRLSTGERVEWDGAAFVVR